MSPADGVVGGRLLPATIRALALLPGPLREVAARTIGLAADLLATRHARTTDTNLALAAPRMPSRTRRALARRSLVEDARLALALPRVWYAAVPTLLATVDGTAAARRLDAAERDGPGVLLLVPHHGNWELLCLWLQARSPSDRPFTALYRPMRDPRVDEWVRARRTRSGAQLVPTDGAGLRALLRALRAGGVVGVLPDQVPPRGAGALAPFHGRDAWTMTLVRSLVRRCAPEEMAATALHTSTGYRIRLLPVAAALGHADPRTAAAALNSTVERCIALAPEQYQWAYKRYRHALGNGDDYYE